MSLTVNTINNVNFTNSGQSKINPKQQSKQTQNPITKNGERSKLLVGTFVAGLGFGTKMLAELLDGDFVVSDLIEAGGNVAKKNFKNASKTKRTVAAVGASVGIIGIFIAGLAILYTIFKAPKISYESKINAFTKGKDMDVYIKGNEIEKDLYTQMNDKAKSAGDDEKLKLKEQYLLLHAAKNRVPDFIDLKR